MANQYTRYQRSLEFGVERAVRKHRNLPKWLKPHTEHFKKWLRRRWYNYGRDDLEKDIDRYRIEVFQKRLSLSDINHWSRLKKIVLKRDNYTCHYCGVVGVRFDIDHKTPLSRGGDNSLDNLTTACQSCNRSKKDKTEEEFISRS